MNTLRKSIFKKTDFIFVVLFTIALYTFVALTCTPRDFGGNDDRGIANYFSGSNGVETATPYNKFVNVILGWCMYGLFQIWQGPNWFMIFQMLIVLISFAMMQYIVLFKLKDTISPVWRYILVGAIFAAFEPTFICRMQFTQAAAIGSFSGMVWMIFSHKQNSKSGLIIGFIFAYFSSLYRFSGFQLIFPYICFILIMFFISDLNKKYTFKNLSDNFVKNRKLYLSIGLLFVVGWTSLQINDSIYNNEYYSEYNKFNRARAAILDYKRAPYRDIEDQLQELGVSENDYYLLCNWAFADPSFFTSDLLEQIAELQPKRSQETNYKEEIHNYFVNLANPEKAYNKLFYMAILLVIICIAIDLKKMIIYAPLLLIMTIAIEIYFTVFVKRYPSYVRTGVIYTFICTLLLMTNYTKLSIAIKRWYWGAIITAGIFLGLSVLGDSYYLEKRGTFKYNMGGYNAYEYMNNREDDFFIMPPNSGVPGYNDSYSIFEIVKPGMSRHIVGLGGWSTNNPWIVDLYHSWGIDYPMSQTADENAYLPCTKFAIINLLQTYLYEHRNIETTASITAEEFGVPIYKIVPDNIIIEQENKGSGSIELTQCNIISTIERFDEIDKEQNFYEIKFNFIADPSNVGDNGRVFLSVEGDSGKTKYFMIFGGHDYTLSDSNEIMVKIPEQFLRPDENYKINLVIQKNGKYYELCEKDTEIRLADVLNI